MLAAGILVGLGTRKRACRCDELWQFLPEGIRVSGQQGRLEAGVVEHRLVLRVCDLPALQDKVEAGTPARIRVAGQMHFDETAGIARGVLGCSGKCAHRNLATAVHARHDRLRTVAVL